MDNNWREEAAQCWSVLGEIALDENLLPEADAQIATAEGIYRSGHTVAQLPRVLIARGELERRRGNREQAGAAIEEALTLAAPRQMKLDHADTLLLRARLELDQAAGATRSVSEASANQANDDAEGALTIARECGYVWMERDALNLLARGHEMLGSMDRGQGFLREATLLSDRLRDRSAPQSPHGELRAKP